MADFGPMWRKKLRELAPLEAGVVPDSYIPTGIARDAEVVQIAASAVSAHEATYVHSTP